MTQFKDKVAIVTGGGSGIGQALCEELGRRGSTVVVSDINLEGAEIVAKSISDAGGKSVVKKLDVTIAKDVEELVGEIATDFGRIDYMFNNAGIGVGGETYTLELEDWKKIIDINLYGVLHGIIPAYSLMVKQGFGHIVNISSLCGLVPVPIKTSYTTTKFALVGLSTALRAEGEDLGVKVSVVCPGFVRTPFYESAHFPKVDSSVRDNFFGMLPQMFSTPEEAAAETLKGVANNKAVIVFPFRSRLLWWAYRIWPKLYNPIAVKTVNNFRLVSKKIE